MPIPNKIMITGTVYIKYIDESPSPKLGDIMLQLNDDATSTLVGDYECERTSGYIKAKIFDGLVWQNISISEFCLERENKFTKKQRALDVAELCRSIIGGYGDNLMYKTYRGHFTLEEYQPGIYNRKSNHGRKREVPRD